MTPKGRWPGLLARRVILMAAVVAATSPAWRLLALGPAPTLDELLALRCGAGQPASPAAASTPAR